MTTKNTEAARYSARGLKNIYAFCWRLQQRVSGSGEITAGVASYLSLRIHPKKWFKEGRSWSIAVT